MDFFIYIYNTVRFFQIKINNNDPSTLKREVSKPYKILAIINPINPAISPFEDS